MRGDALLLHQVLVNILSNAIKYTRTRELAVIEIAWRTGRADKVAGLQIGCALDIPVKSNGGNRKRIA